MNLEQYRESFPKEIAKRTVGREAEIPLVWANDCTSGDASKLWFDFPASWTPFFDDINIDLCVGVENKTTGWKITTDASFGIIEVISPPCEDLFELSNGFNQVMKILKEVATRHGMALLGYGIQPKTPPSKDLWVPKGRYAALRSCLDDKFAHNPTICASDQCHVSIAQDEIVRATNVMNALSGAIIALAGNSTISSGLPNGTYAYRELVWDKFNGFEGQVGIPPKASSLEEWFDYLISQRFVLRKKEDGTYEPRGETFKEYLAKNEPTKTDFLYHEGCCWWTARPRAAYGTIEVRPACQQPPHENMVVQALTLGLVNNLQRSEDIARNLVGEFAREDRDIAANCGLHKIPGYEHWPHELSLLHLLKPVLAVAEEGLLMRGLGEETFLKPLYDRLNKKILPGDIALNLWDAKRPQAFMNYFSY